MFSHRCQIKNVLSTFNLDNGSHKKLISEDLVRQLSLQTTLHPLPYQLGWVRKDSPSLQVHQHSVVTFAIRPFYDMVICDVAPLDCANMLLGLPYQQACNVIYHAKTHRYHLQHEGRTYILNSTTPPHPKHPPLHRNQTFM